ncbi:MAG: hypothetical protein IPJ48_21485 [Propionivibrio sp.]|uniref:Uncharacterized protein n=1 Tax=Candidatus Propionivibrio dominans TaxID=2954373 RepID=A0A9D7IAR4_9RHOO|nr:hypothetical protein [Candidatus Propionivibrio dominans]
MFQNLRESAWNDRPSLECTVHGRHLRFLVASAQRLVPEAIWPICLVVLALPGPNYYRNELLREYGCWFFMMLSFWLALRWSENPRWGSALIVQLALAITALFRPEALVFFTAFVMWQLFEAPKESKLRRVLMIVGIPLVVALLMFVLIGILRGLVRVNPEGWSGYVMWHLGQVAWHLNPIQERLNHIIDLLNPATKQALFNVKAQALAGSLFILAKDGAGTILFLGSLAIIPLKFIKQLSLFIFPFLYLFHGGLLRSVLSRAPLFAWAFLAHLLVLSAYVIDWQFLSGRYIAVLSLLAAPFIGFGFWELSKRFPRWKHVMLLLSFVIMFNNAVSFRKGQPYFIRAGEWLAKNSSENSRIYVESPRTAYYAGWRQSLVSDPLNRPDKTGGMPMDNYDFIVLEVPHSDTEIGPWLTRNKLRVLQRFENSRKDSVIIATNESAP